MWPFAKLLNGFGSHRYIYSPILLDSQHLNEIIYLHQLQPQLGTPVLLLLYYQRYVGRRWGMEMCTTSYHLSFLVPLQVQLLLVTMVTGLLPMGNGDADWNNSGSCCGTSSWYIYYASRSGFNNGEWRSVCHLLPGWDAAPAPGYYCGRSCELGNGEWRMMCCTCCQGCGSCTMSICQLGEGQWAMEPMDGATIPGKMYSKV